MIASAQERPRGGAGLAPAFAAARSRLGLIAVLLVLAGVELVVDDRPDAGHGRGALDRSGRAGLVHRRVGRDDGRDDVAVDCADGGALCAHDQGAISAFGAAVRGGLSRDVVRGVGVVAFAVAVAGSRIAGDVLAWDRAGRWVAAATLVSAAVYELTPLKDACLGKCRSPLGFLLGAWREGWSGSLQMGAKNGAWCVGCCWALMASLFALGIMSIAWMAFVAALIAVEKTLPWASRRDLRDGGDPPRLGRAPARSARRDPGPHDPRERLDESHGCDGNLRVDPRCAPVTPRRAALSFDRRSTVGRR